MALPDLDTDTVGWISYWNHLDNGADDIDPFAAESALTNPESYSNGVQGLYDWNGENWRVRVKSDGWIIAFLDAGEPVVKESAYWSTNNLSPADSGAGARVILQIRDELPNTGASTFNVGDVARHNYEYGDATTIHTTAAKNGSNDGSPYWDVKATSDTTLYASSGGCGSDSAWVEDDNENHLYDFSPGGTHDLIANGYLSAGDYVRLGISDGALDTVTLWS
jgi:hypothetical protein